jgi:hypothetical protein
MLVNLPENGLVLFSCEGGFETVAVKKLLTSGKLILSKDDVIGIASDRSIADIQRDYLGFDYGDRPVTILRIVDSPSKRFALGRLYRERFEVKSVFTRPEAEILVIINEGCYSDYSKRKNRMKPSVYCKQILGMKNVKSVSFLEQYWNVDALADSAREYRRLSNMGKGELCIADLLLGE